MAVVPNTNVNLATNVRDVLNGAGASVGNDVKAYFSSSVIKAWWSKFKPTIYPNEPFLDDDRRWQGSNGLCGFTSGSVFFNTVDALVNAYKNKATFVYDVPQGTASEPMRLGDFRGYKTDAKPPIWDFYINGSFKSGNTSSSIDCELVDNHSGLDASYNLVMGNFSVNGGNVANWYFGVVIVANGKFFKKSHTGSIGSSATITNRIFTVTYSEVANACGSFSSFSAYPCLFQYANGSSGLVMALPCAAAGGSFASGGVSGTVTTQTPSVGWVGNTYYYKTARGRLFTGVIGYPSSLEGSKCSIQITIYRTNGTSAMIYSNSSLTLSKTGTAGNNSNRMDFSQEVRADFTNESYYVMSVSGGSDGLASRSTPSFGGTDSPI